MSVNSLYSGVGFHRLITVNQTKLNKATKLGYLSAGLHLAPHAMSGHNVCAFASEGCRGACLTFSGQGGIGLDKNNMNGCQRARIARTRLWFDDRGRFWTMFDREMQAFERRAERLSLWPTFRPNLTSDIRWETKGHEWAALPGFHKGGHFLTMFERFGSVRFMDYTAYPVHRRLYALNEIPNYHLTFSLKENNDAAALQAIAAGVNVAAVLRVKKSEAMPIEWSGRPCIDGDKHDLRFLDPRGHDGKGIIVGLRPKGSKGILDNSGFIRDVSSELKPVALAVA